MDKAIEHYALCSDCAGLGNRPGLTVDFSPFLFCTTGPFGRQLVGCGSALLPEK